MKLSQLAENSLIIKLWVMILCDNFVVRGVVGSHVLFRHLILSILICSLGASYSKALDSTTGDEWVVVPTQIQQKPVETKEVEKDLLQQERIKWDELKRKMKDLFFRWRFAHKSQGFLLEDVEDREVDSVSGQLASMREQVLKDYHNLEFEEVKRDFEIKQYMMAYSRWIIVVNSIRPQQIIGINEEFSVHVKSEYRTATIKSVLSNFYTNATSDFEVRKRGDGVPHGNWTLF